MTDTARKHEQVIATVTGAVRTPDGETFDPITPTTAEIEAALEWQLTDGNSGSDAKRGARRGAHNYIRENGLEPLAYAPERD